MSGNYTAAALEGMGRSNNGTSRTDAVSKLITAAGGTVVCVYFTADQGPGALVIFEADPTQARAICGVVKSSGGIENMKFTRLTTQDEIPAIRAARRQIASSYVPPGQ
jgi:uncharacterized protein with GYD domain